jgi:soluble lytic murein transglycosylase-like protein
LVPISGNPLVTVFVAATLTFSGPAVQIEGVRDAALSWHIPPEVPIMRGLRLLMDAGRRAPPAAKIAREAMRANPRLDAVDALLLATDVIDAARANGLPPAFLAATILQESAFDPRAVSSAGAIGIAQFTVPTAAEYGVDPWDPRSAIGGASQVLSAYVTRYRGRDDDPYALALAAYDAGPAAVTRYHGVPPYAETRDYIIDIRDRWSRIVGR